MNPNQTEYTYGGVTVKFTDAQNAILTADSQAISDLNSMIADLNRQFLHQDNLVNIAISNLAHCDDLYKIWASDPATVAMAIFNTPGWIIESEKRKGVTNLCISQNNANWKSARSVQGGITNSIAKAKEDIISATTKLNNDLITFQNAIKLQIQAQIANVAANTQGAANDPATIAGQVQLNIRKEEEATAQEKLKQETTTKIAAFIVIAGVLVFVAILIFRRLGK